MSIVVTPIPQLIDLAAPAFTLGTANAAGSAATAVASDSTLLAFDTTDPAAVAASAVVGSATVSARRDHVHAGTTATGTVVDEAITRFDGTGGASLQGYSSLSPTISDAGIISLTSGALKFPATAIASADDTTLDDYQQGSWTPCATDETGHSPDGYSTQGGAYTKIGNRVFITGTLTINGDTNLVSTQGLRICGLPFTPQNTANLGQWLVASGDSFAITAGSNIVLEVVPNNTIMNIKIWDTSTGITGFLVSEFTGNGIVSFSGHYIV
jgi:hypothetical protein